MNELNYASLEASKKLVENGIVLDEVDFMWFERETDDWILIPSDHVSIKAFQDGHAYPAPCFTDIWRNLPERIKCNRKQKALHFEKWRGESYASYENNYLCKSANPINAMIHLLVLVKGAGK